VVVRVTGENDPPEAVADSFNVNIGSSLVVNPGNSILGNDTDPDAAEAIKNAVLVSLPSSAASFSRSVNETFDGTFIYTHNNLSEANDSFTYKVNDGDIDSNTVSVQLVVVNTKPRAVADSAEVFEGEDVTVSVLANDEDDETLARAVVAAVSNPVNGTVQIDPLDATRVIFSHGGAEPNQPASFQYTLKDPFLTSDLPATVTLTVKPRNDSPEAFADDIRLNIGATATTLVGGANSVLANDQDDENDTLSAELVTPPAFASNFTLNADGTFSYQHNGSNNLSDSFVYLARDNSSEESNPNAASNAVTVDITIFNTAPVAVADSVSVNEFDSVNIDVLANDNDAETGSGRPALSVNSISGAINGVATLQTDGTVTFAHDGTETTTASFQYTASDGFLTSNTVTVSIAVTPINDSPRAFTEVIAVDIGGSATTIQDSGASSVLANDTDAENDTLTAVLVPGGDVSQGSLTLNADGTFVYTHNGSGVLSDSFTYRARDNSSEPSNPNAFSEPVVVNISVANTPPTAVNDTASVVEGQTVVIDVLANDSDPETVDLLVGTVSNVVNGSFVVDNNAITFTHNGSENPTASLQYTASDGFLVSTPALVTISVEPRNDSPVANDDVIAVDIAGTATTLVGGATSVLDDDTDAENDALGAELVVGPAFASNFVLNADGSFSYTHNGSDNLSDSFSYRARDNSGEASNPNATSNVATVSISIANTAPTAVNDVATVNEGQAVSIAVLGNDLDSETAATGVSSVSNVINGEAVIETDGTITFTHDGSETTTASFDYIANDGFLPSVAAATVSITVNPINDSPSAVADAIEIGIAGTATSLIGGNTSVVTNDSDPESDSLSALLVSAPTFASSFSLNHDGSFSYTHDGSNNLSDVFRYRAQDDSSEPSNPLALSNIVSVTISVSNTPPLAVADVASVAEGASVILDVLANDSDNETGVPTIVKNLLNVTNGSAVINSDNTISYTHDGSETSEASFEYTANDGFLDSLSSALVSLVVTPTNDPPSIAPLSDVVATESLPMPTLIAVGSDVDDANDGVNLLYSLVNAPVGMTISNDSASPGQINWIPPRSGVFNEVHGPITVLVSDGGEHNAAPAGTTFSVTVSPPDADDDLLPDYADLCPTIADASNADFDGDGTPGIDLDATDAHGGDACDNDDDNDGMPDAFELANNLDPFDPADAAGDLDGDGISNLDEFSAGTSPLLGPLVIDSTGYLTAFSIQPPAPSSIHPNATAITSSNPGPYRPGLHRITWTASNPANRNLASSEQLLSVRPLVSLHANQTVVEGSSVSIGLSLNGDAASYPVEVDYSVSGTAGAEDHDARSGSVVIEASSARSASISFNVAEDSLADGGETVVLTLNGARNAVIGSRASATITIQEGNETPSVGVQIVQGGKVVSAAFVDQGEVTVNAVVSDPNQGQSHRYDWSATANVLLAPSDSSSSSWTFTPSSGVFAIDLLVSDDGSPNLQTRARRLLKIDAQAPVLSGGNDSDGDGVNDLSEGLGDTDDDGVADYLDAVDQPNLLQSQAGSNVDGSLLQAEQGLKLKVGGTAYAAGASGAAITDDTIQRFGGNAGDAPQNADDDHEHVGGVYDFEISGLAPGSAVRLVIPLQSSIPRNARYRKFDAANGWRTFVEDGVNNRLFSAFAPGGACPEPGSAFYTPGLSYLHNCLQILIEDGGPNDPDGQANGVIRDPGALGVQLSEPVRPVLQQGGAIGQWALLSLLVLGFYRLQRRFACLRPVPRTRQ
jgi:hypothetical protein